MPKLSKSLQKFWYEAEQYSALHPLRLLMLPLHLIIRTLVSCRKNFYQYNIFSSTKVNAAVIIVGNISVGGTGKSPLVMHLAHEMSQMGYQIGILSRGYGAGTSTFPQKVELDSLATDVGDEPLMLRLRTNCPVVIDPNRVRGANYLIDEYQCDLILCDDGLQHYALQRDIELVVIDGVRKFGNKMMLPFGPLREPLSRINSVDGVVVNQATDENFHINQFNMHLSPTVFCRVNAPDVECSIKEFIRQVDNEAVEIVAAIGNPQRFFNQIKAFNIQGHCTSFSDHYQFKAGDFKSMEGIVIMTEKDAIKCKSFASDKHWFLRVAAELEPSISDFCHKRLLERTT